MGKLYLTKEQQELSNQAFDIVARNWLIDDVRHTKREEYIEKFQKGMRQASLELLELYLPTMDPESVQRAEKTANFLLGKTNAW